MRIKTQASVQTIFLDRQNEDDCKRKIKADLCRVAADELFKKVELEDKGLEKMLFPNEPERNRFEVVFTVITEQQLTLIASCVKKIRHLANDEEVSKLLDEIKKELVEV